MRATGSCAAQNPTCNQRTMADDEKHLANPEHLLAALRRKHGRDDLTLTDFRVSRATPNVLGITSVILRVRAEVRTGAGECLVDSLVVKREPLCKAQLDLVNTCSSFEREIEYLTEYVPILEANLNGPVSLVRCLEGRQRVLVMEDLCAEGYQSLVSTIGDLKNPLITFTHAEAVCKALARLHAASLGVDWIQKFPKYLPNDPLFDGEGGDVFKTTMDSIIDGFIFLLNDEMKLEFPEVIHWLKNSQIHKQMIDIVKSNKFVVLCQGDPWANNILFRHSGDTFDLKFVDFQLGRVAPSVCDLLYFLYTSTNTQFRVHHEQNLLEIYFQEFTDIAKARQVSGADEMEFLDFLIFYQKAKVYGLAFALACRPMLHMHKCTPSKEMSDEKFNEFMKRDYSTGKENAALQSEVCEIFKEIIQYYIAAQN